MLTRIPGSQAVRSASNGAGRIWTAQSESQAFTAAIHVAQKHEGLWLAQHPFVQAVSGGSATREDLRGWVRQVYCTTKTYGEVLRSLSPPPPVGVWLDPWRDLDRLIQLGGALGIPPRGMAASAPNLATRGLQIWLRHHLTAPSRHIGAQACWALVESMNPEVGAYLADGVARYFGLDSGELGYLTVAMKSRGADRYAASLLCQIPREEWPSVQTQTLLVSRLKVQLYSSIGAARHFRRDPVRPFAHAHRGWRQVRMASMD